MADSISTKSIEEFRSWFPELSEKFFTNFSVVRIQFTFENRFSEEEAGSFLKTFTYNKETE
jgi:hypothetical protein